MVARKASGEASLAVGSGVSVSSGASGSATFGDGVSALGNWTSLRVALVSAELSREYAEHRRSQLECLAALL